MYTCETIHLKIQQNIFYKISEMILCMKWKDSLFLDVWNDHFTEWHDSQVKTGKFPKTTIGEWIWGLQICNLDMNVKLIGT